MNFVDQWHRTKILFVKFFACFSLILMSSGSANANLIVNGSFENKDIPNHSWRWYTADQIDGWSGSNIELWQAYGGVQAFDGEQFAELNSHSNNGQPFVIFQTIQTQINELYDLSFAYRARSSGNEKFRLDIVNNGTVFYSKLFDDHVKGAWSGFSSTFAAVGSETTIKFTSVYPETKTVGNFIDVVRVVNNLPELAISTVSEPGFLVLFMMSIFGLVYYRKRNITTSS